jgi:hypothetical protein
VIGSRKDHILEDIQTEFGLSCIPKVRKVAYGLCKDNPSALSFWYARLN